MANGSITTNLALLDCTQSETVTVERVNYFPRQLLTADDMFADQDYFRVKLRRHNRFMHGWGTVCGLAVTAAPTTNSPWLVRISAGYALGPYGDEIFVGESVDLDLSACGPSAVTNPCEPGSLFGGGNGLNTGSVVYIAIQYSECMARPVSVTPAGCGCDQTTCQNSRIRDSFQIQCLASLPSSFQVSQPTATMCDYVNHQEVPDCPPCPTSPWVVLAAVSLPASSSTQVADGIIDNFTFRRQIFSTAVLQNQVEECCCAPSTTPTPTPTPPPPPPPPTTVTTINFTPGQQFFIAPQFIKVTFSRPVLRSSVTANTFFVTPQGLANSTGTITFDDNSASQITLSATFTPDANSAFNNPTSYTVTVAGNPPTAVTDINNLPLDGDANGQPGGNYTAIFSVQFLIL